MAFSRPPELQAQASSLLFLTVVFALPPWNVLLPSPGELRSTLWVHVADAVITYPTVISLLLIGSQFKFRHLPASSLGPGLLQGGVHLLGPIFQQAGPCESGPIPMAPAPSR